MKNEKVGCLEILGLFLAIAIIFAFAYWVATSDLPEWLKFYLLK